MQLILPRIGRAAGPFPRTCFNAHIVSVRVLPLLRDAFSQTSPTGVDLLNDSKPTFYYRITQLSYYAMHEQKNRSTRRAQTSVKAGQFSRT